MENSPKSRPGVDTVMIAALIGIIGVASVALIMIYANRPSPPLTLTPTTAVAFTSTVTGIPAPTDTIPPGEPTSTPPQEAPTAGPTFTPAIDTLTPFNTGNTLTPIVTEPLSVEQQLAQIDQSLKQSLTASIAYNAPAIMRLDDSTTIELLLNPAIPPEVLATQVTESGQVEKASVEITPRMKAVLKAQEQDAFDIQPLHDNPEQIISGTSTTKWSWFVTAKKAGLHRLTIVIYRLVKYDGQDYWREVESYKADIDVKVPFGQRVQTLDWKWIAGFILALIGSVLGVLTWLNNRNKGSKVEKPKEDKPVKKARK